MISIVIPAHNESSVIERALRAMTNGATDGELDLIVVCNGCNDDTAEIARHFGFPVRVIETDIAGKANALNIGDKAARYYPRIFADADVVITLATIRVLATRLRKDKVLAVAPLAYVELSGCPWMIRAYFDVKSQLPQSREGIGGSGVYALSEAGRRRFQEFPDVTSDDGYVRVQFAPEERETVAAVRSIVFAPQTLRDLIATRTRVYYGGLELASLFPELWKNTGERNNEALIRLLRYPPLWPGLMIYLCVNLLARRRAMARFRSKTFIWERDDTSRKAGAISRQSARSSQ